MWVKVRVTCFSHLVGSGHLSILVFSDLPSKAQIDLPKGIFKILSLSVRASDFHLVRSSFYVSVNHPKQGFSPQSLHLRADSQAGPTAPPSGHKVLQLVG